MSEAILKSKKLKQKGIVEEGVAMIGEENVEQVEVMEDKMSIQKRRGLEKNPR